MRLRVLLAIPLLMVPLSGCDTGKPRPPALIDASEIDGDLTPIEDFKPRPVELCDMEPATVLDDGRADRFRAWNRTINGHREQVVVAVWAVEEETAASQLAQLTTEIGECKAAHLGSGYAIEAINDGDPSAGFRISRFRGGPRLYVERIYAWHDGYMLTAWAQSQDGHRTARDLTTILETQRNEFQDR